MSKKFKAKRNSNGNSLRDQFAELFDVSSLNPFQHQHNTRRPTRMDMFSSDIKPRSNSSIHIDKLLNGKAFTNQRSIGNTMVATKRIFKLTKEV